MKRGDIVLKALRAAGERMFTNAMEANVVAINRLMARAPGSVMLDVGCDDGSRSLSVYPIAAQTRTRQVVAAYWWLPRAQS